MLRIIILCAIALAAQAYKMPGCVMGDWQPWGPCVSSKVCPRNSGPQSDSFDLDPTIMDAGRHTMEVMMREKATYWRAQLKCYDEGKCPGLFGTRSAGPAACVDGMAGEYPCRNVDQVSFISMDDLGYPRPPTGDPSYKSNDLWGWTDPQTGDEYVIFCMSGGTSFVRITPDPENPVVLGFLPTRTTAVTWRDVKVVNDHAFIVSEAADHGMQIFDLRTLRNINSFQPLTAHAEYSGFGQAHNIVSNPETQYVYVVGSRRGDYPNICRGGLYMIDVREPLNPQFAGCFGDDGYVHDAQCMIYRGPDTRYQGREICYCYNEDSFTIVDVNNKNSPTIIAKKGYEGYAYTHQGWVTEDETIALMDDELDESRHPTDKRTRTFVWDISNLDDPLLQNTYYSSQTAIDHNQYVLGNFTYQSNYKAGLRVLRIDNEEFGLTETGYFDVHPEETTATFSGSWSNYPYFASGVIPVSSMPRGLFLLRANTAQMEQDFQQGKVYAEQSRHRDILQAADANQCPAVVETRQCVATKC